MTNSLSRLYWNGCNGDASNNEWIALCLQVRLPSDVSDDVDEDPTGNKAIWDRGLLSGASQKVSEGAQVGQRSVMLWSCRLTCCVPTLLGTQCSPCIGPLSSLGAQNCWCTPLYQEWWESWSPSHPGRYGSSLSIGESGESGQTVQYCTLCVICVGH